MVSKFVILCGVASSGLGMLQEKFFVESLIMGMLQIGIRVNFGCSIYKENFLMWVSQLVVGNGDVTNWYQSPTFNTEPAWAI
jgi:hypothetical protein